jgi:hypothetical protein
VHAGVSTQHSARGHSTCIQHTQCPLTIHAKTALPAPACLPAKQQLNPPTHLGEGRATGGQGGRGDGEGGLGGGAGGLGGLGG